jgi:hypothetical protein
MNRQQFFIFVCENNVFFQKQWKQKTQNNYLILCTLNYIENKN